MPKQANTHSRGTLLVPIGQQQHNLLNVIHEGGKTAATGTCMHAPVAAATGAAAARILHMALLVAPHSQPHLRPTSLPAGPSAGP